jgi:hypothetical protein
MMSNIALIKDLYNPRPHHPSFLPSKQANTLEETSKRNTLNKTYRVRKEETSNPHIPSHTARTHTKQSVPQEGTT